MAAIKEKWADKLDLLPSKDYIKLTKSILRDEPEPQITSKYQPIASDIYKDINRADYYKKAMQKSREKAGKNLSVN